MSDIKNLHRMSMEQLDQALILKKLGKEEEANDFFYKAFELERRAAYEVAENFNEEPTRSILLRSAASLALDCDKSDEAEKLICLALTGNPPENIATELRDLLENVYFKRHLQLRGVTLSENEVQMSIAGEGVGFGIAPTSLFLNRIHTTETMLLRTAERLAEKPYRDSGRYSKSIQEDVELYMTTPRAASFAVTFKVGGREQYDLPGMSKGAKVINEVINNIDVYYENGEEALREFIKDEAYFKNFVSLADNLIPDGDEVNLVGFTLMSDTGVREISIRPRQKTLIKDQHPTVKIIEINDENDFPTEIIGHLKFASSKNPKNEKIEIIDEEGNSYGIKVPEGMMNDIVKPLWNEKVIAHVERKGKSNILDRIKPYKD